MLWRYRAILAVLLLAAGCAPPLVDMLAEREREWRLELAIVANQKQIPTDLAWLVLSNDSAEDKLACLETESWGVRIESTTKGSFGPQGVCKELSRYQLVRSKASVILPIRIRPEELPLDREFEFEFIFPELPWPPLLGEPEWRSPRWKGTVESARRNGETLVAKPEVKGPIGSVGWFYNLRNGVSKGRSVDETHNRFRQEWDHLVWQQRGISNTGALDVMAGEERPSRAL